MWFCCLHFVASALQSTVTVVIVLTLYRPPPYSFFVSAKNDDLINNMFMRMVAHVLKIKLSSSDLSRVATVVTAKIMSHDNGGTTKIRQPVEKTKSSFCTVQ